LRDHRTAGVSLDQGSLDRRSAYPPTELIASRNERDSQDISSAQLFPARIAALADCVMSDQETAVE
jgi:hypothetical protein